MDDACFNLFLLRLVQNIVAEDDNSDRHRAKDQIAVQEYFSLGSEQFLIVSQSIVTSQRQILPVDHVVIAANEDVPNLVRQDNENECDEGLRVDDMTAARHEENGDKQAEGAQVYTTSEYFCEDAELVVVKIIILSGCNH